MTAAAPRPSVVALVAAITAAADASVGVDAYEHLLAQLLDLLASGEADRAEAVAELDRLATEWPAGAPEILEFTMHRLRWPEVRQALDDHRAQAADFRTRDLAAQVLQAFDDDWPAGEIYRTYREA